MKTIIKDATIVNESRVFKGDIVIVDDRIESIGCADDSADVVINADGCIVMPGVIDTHVHFREPGMTHKACIETESKAAAFGGVTSFFDMPNTNPQTTSLDALSDKVAIAERDSHVNYTFFFGATNDNVQLLDKIDKSKVPGIKLFMGSSTGNMLVDSDDALDTLFAKASALNLPVMTHCEDTQVINANIECLKKAEAMKKGGKEGILVEDLPVELHPQIRSSKACFDSSSKAVELARRHRTHLHIAHLTTSEELSLMKGDENITAEATPAHLLFTAEDYKTLGTRIKCNPAVKSASDRDALRAALCDGRITTVGTDHAPHLLHEKEGGALKAVSGMPMVQFSLPAMLSLVDEGIIDMPRLVELMCHAPARLFAVKNRGFIRKGYKADIVIVRPDTPWTITPETVVSRCGWSPLEGRTFNWKVEKTICNGHLIYDNGEIDDSYRGEQLTFEH